MCVCGGGGGVKHKKHTRTHAHNVRQGTTQALLRAMPSLALFSSSSTFPHTNTQAHRHTHAHSRQDSFIPHTHHTFSMRRGTLRLLVLTIPEPIRLHLAHTQVRQAKRVGGPVRKLGGSRWQHRTTWRPTTRTHPTTIATTAAAASADANANASTRGRQSGGVGLEGTTGALGHHASSRCGGRVQAMGGG